MPPPPSPTASWASDEERAVDGAALDRPVDRAPAMIGAARSGNEPDMRLGLLLLALSSTAWAWGPTVSVGPSGTISTLRSQPALYLGHTVRVGLEFGTIVNHEVALEVLGLPRLDEPGLANALMARYTLSIDFLGKRGFTPLLGLGVSGGRFLVSAPSERAGGWAASAFATAGVRYTFDFGLSLKGELQGGLYGPGLWTATPSLTAAWRF